VHSQAEAGVPESRLTETNTNLPKDWREITINEAMVELPQAALDLSSLSDRQPIVGGVAQAAVSGLAFARAYQTLRGPSLEQKLEGASSLCLGLAGALSFVPGAVAAQTAKTLNFGQAAFELTLGLRELHEELTVDETPDWKEIATGALDTIKGASAFVPLFWPQTQNIVTGIQVGAMVSKMALESTIHRSTDE
jgi:hypothetical protein